MSEHMEQVHPLLGLERLMVVCRKNDIPMDLQPPPRAPPKAGELVCGLPLDPVLAAIYTRSRRMVFEGELDGFFLHRANDSRDLIEVNEDRPEHWPEAFRTSLFFFGGEPALAYYYATVPRLADEQRVQPVVWVDTYEDLYALPLASSVDRFFDTYSHSLERQVELIREDAEFKARLEAEFGPPAPDSLRALWSKDIPRINFPWEVPDLIARDEPLVRLLRAGRFDFLMEGCEDAHKWVGKVLAAAST
ncbi:hypothetical protein [Archangium sp.]|uniref:hypothetical protein n=1 Tax=Archangium sp. TaxID=1872627 RepID=UPI002D5470FE|nr:hypothetical protein [Archangium sp.]HYO54835.1 hypothetical protein [Archangium sp.]